MLRATLGIPFVKTVTCAGPGTSGDIEGERKPVLVQPPPGRTGTKNTASLSSRWI